MKINQWGSSCRRGIHLSSIIPFARRQVIKWALKPALIGITLMVPFRIFYVMGVSKSGLSKWWRREEVWWARRCSPSIEHPSIELAHVITGHTLWGISRPNKCMIAIISTNISASRWESKRVTAREDNLGTRSWGWDGWRGKTFDEQVIWNKYNDHVVVPLVIFGIPRHTYN